MFRTLQKTRFIPAGSRKVQHKKSSAFVYLYEKAGAFLLVAYHGKALKPDFHYRYSTEEQRAKRVREFFSAWERIEGQRVERREEIRKANQNADWAVGQVLVSSWGYEQTNVQWYQITAIKGAKIWLRELAQEQMETSSMAGYCVPKVGEFIGETIECRRRAGSLNAKYDQRAYPAEFDEVAGIKVYRRRYWSSYA